MAAVNLELVVDFDADSRIVWDEMIDWKAHEAWIPATRVEVDTLEGSTADGTAVGATFTAWTGIGKLALEDRMRVTECTWNDDTQVGQCAVEKLGPVLQGTAGFTVRPTPAGSEVEWIEAVTVPYVPQFLAPIASAIGAAGFKLGMKRLNRQLSPQ